MGKSERVLDKVEQVILEGRRLVAKADAMLRRAEEFRKECGFDPGELEKLIRQHMTPAERETVECAVKDAIRAVHEEAERAAESARPAPRSQRKNRTKMIV
jgi:hypothetical protein